MAFYKARKMKANGKYYPVAVLVAQAAGTDEIARQIAEASTVSKADIVAVLAALPSVMARLMNEGRSVRLENIGSFRYTINAKKGGKETDREVSANDIEGTRIRFVPETSRKAGTAGTRTLVGSDISWNRWDGQTLPDETEGTGSSGSGSEGGSGSGSLPDYE